MYEMVTQHVLTGECQSFVDVSRLLSKITLASVVHCWHSEGAERGMALGSAVNLTFFEVSHKICPESSTQKSVQRPGRGRS